MSRWIIERLDRTHARDMFDCGDPTLNDWLIRRAGQFDRKDLARTYVAIPTDSKVVVGYYALSNHWVSFDALPQEQAKGLPRINIPVVLLGRLAADVTCRGQGLGQLLLVDALRRTQLVAEHVGVRGIEVHAIDDAAKTYYLKFGFQPLLDQSNHLYLPMAVIRRLLN